MHLVFRLSPEPLWIVGERGPTSVVGAIVGGARARAYVRDVSTPAATVGVQLRAGASCLAFEGAASLLAGAHTPLDALWGDEAERLRARLGDEQSLERRLELVEAALLARLARARAVHPAVAAALARLGDASHGVGLHGSHGESRRVGLGFDDGSRGARDDSVRSDAIRADDTIRGLVAESGYSHRRFVTLFTDAVGLSPKRYARVVRFGRALAALPSARSCARLAQEMGYADQAHFNREFREMTGMTPSAYLAAAPAHRHHVPVAAR